MKEELMLSSEVQNIGQAEYDDIQMAIQKLSSLSQEQFEEIKNEKWYNRLWDMVTFSQKGKKRLAEQIGTVAQAQQILVEMLLRLSEKDRNISELVVKNAAYIERIQRDNIYLLSEINLLKDKIADINVKVKYDANIRDLNDEEKRALSGCLYNLAGLNDAPNTRQKDYLNTILNYVDENTRMENPFAAIEDFDNKIKGKILACCMEYMFLENNNTEAFDKYQDFIDEFDCGKKTISDIQDQVVSIYNARGEQGFIDRYRNLDIGIPSSFYIDFDEDASQEDDYDEINRKGISALNDQNYEEAARLFKIAADHGNADAQNRYGVRLFHGQGVPENKNEAIKYFMLAAEQEHPKAMENLAGHYRDGDFIEKNDGKAKELLRKAADRGEETAIKKLLDWYGIWMGEISEEVIGDNENRDSYRPQSIIEIPHDKSVRIINKIIEVTSFVKLTGRLQIENCEIYYNGDSARGEIELSDSAELSVKNTSIICRGYNERPLVKAEGKGIRIDVEKCDLIDCNYLFGLSSFSKFTMSFCHIANAGDRMLVASHGSDAELSVDDCYFELGELKEFNKKNNYLTVANFGSCWDSEAKAYMIRNCLFKQTAAILDSDDDDFGYSFIYGEYTQINNCTIKGMRGLNASFSSALFFDDVFEDSQFPVQVRSSRYISPKIDNCIFKQCKNVIELERNSKVVNCQFVSCSENIIRSAWDGGCKVEYCEFVNIRHDPSKKVANYFWDNSCLTFRRSKGKEPSVNSMVHCIFNGADVGDWLLIDITGYEKPAGDVLNIENCDFRNCKTTRKTLIGEFINYTGLLNSSKSVKGVYKYACTGLENTNGSGSVDMSQIKIKEIGSDGERIGMSHTEEEIISISGASNV